MTQSLHRGDSVMKATMNTFSARIGQEDIMFDRYLLQVAQGELAIAVCLGDGALWQRAMQKMKTAINAPWYRR